MTLLTLDGVTHLWLAVDLGLMLYGILRLRGTPLAVGVVGVLVGLLPVLGLRTLDLFAALRFLAWMLFLYGPIFLVFLAVHGLARRPRRRPSSTGDRLARGLCAVLALIIAGVGVQAFFLEPTSLQVTRYTLTSSKVDEPLLIAIVADLQSDAPGAYERRALQAALEPGPDLVLMPGDYVQHPDPTVNARLREELRALLREVGLDATHGVVAVRGNVEYPQWRQIFQDLPVVTAEQTRVVPAGPVTVTALSFRDGFDPRLTVPPQPGLHVVVAHAPDFALGEIEADLLVAGHTHGGQVRLPGIGPLVTFSRVPNAWAAGRTELDGGRTLVVSRGVGMERGLAPRLRFFCPPEVVLVEVLPETSGR